MTNLDIIIHIWRNIYKTFVRFNSIKVLRTIFYYLLLFIHLYIIMSSLKELKKIRQKKLNAYI